MSEIGKKSLKLKRPIGLLQVSTGGIGERGFVSSKGKLAAFVKFKGRRRPYTVKSFSLRPSYQDQHNQFLTPAIWWRWIGWIRIKFDGH